MSLTTDIVGAISRLLAPLLGDTQKQITDLKAQLSASASQIALLQAAATADHGTISGLQSKATADAASIVALKAEIEALKATAGHEVDPEPEHEADSPEGYSVAPGGQTITLAGVRSRIGTDKKIYRNDVVQPWSGNVEELFVHNGVLWQFAAWGGEGVTQGFFEARQGAPLVVNDPRLPEPPPVVVPPPAPTDGVLRDFTGLTIVANNWDQPWQPSTWWKEVSTFSADNVKVVGPNIVLNVNGNTAGGEIQADESQRFLEGRVTMEATVDKVAAGLIVAPLWIYGNYGDGNGDKAEVDFELIGNKGLQLAVHNHGQMGIYVKVIPGDFTGKHTYAIAYKASEYVEWFLDGKSVGRCTPKDLDGRAPFPDVGMKPLADIWPTSNEAWAGKWAPVNASLTLHRYGLAKVR